MTPDDELEPMTEPYDWDEAFAQNPDEVGVALDDLAAGHRAGYQPTGEHARMYEAAEEAGADMLAGETEDHLAALAELAEDEPTPDR